LFVNGPFEYKPGPDTSNIPVVNRALPTPAYNPKPNRGKHLDNPNLLPPAEATLDPAIPPPFVNLNDRFVEGST
jgi:hypothetical protein